MTYIPQLHCLLHLTWVLQRHFNLWFVCCNYLSDSLLVHGAFIFVITGLCWRLMCPFNDDCILIISLSGYAGAIGLFKISCNLMMFSPTFIFKYQVSYLIRKGNCFLFSYLIEEFGWIKFQCYWIIHEYLIK